MSKYNVQPVIDETNESLELKIVNACLAKHPEGSGFNNEIQKVLRKLVENKYDDLYSLTDSGNIYRYSFGLLVREVMAFLHAYAIAKRGDVLAAYTYLKNNFPQKSQNYELVNAFKIRMQQHKSKIIADAGEIFSTIDTTKLTDDFYLLAEKSKLKEIIDCFKAIEEQPPEKIMVLNAWMHYRMELVTDGVAAFEKLIAENQITALTFAVNQFLIYAKFSSFLSPAQQLTRDNLISLSVPMFRKIITNNIQAVSKCLSTGNLPGAVHSLRSAQSCAKHVAYISKINPLINLASEEIDDPEYFSQSLEILQRELDLYNARIEHVELGAFALAGRVIDAAKGLKSPRPARGYFPNELMLRNDLSLALIKFWYKFDQRSDVGNIKAIDDLGKLLAVYLQPPALSFTRLSCCGFNDWQLLDQQGMLERIAKYLALYAPHEGISRLVFIPIAPAGSNMDVEIPTACTVIQAWAADEYALQDLKKPTAPSGP